MQEYAYLLFAKGCSYFKRKRRVIITELTNFNEYLGRQLKKASALTSKSRYTSIDLRMTKVINKY